ncbi:MAG: hypothetical protein AAFX54_15155 [Pseudomonadota bacterium]
MKVSKRWKTVLALKVPVFRRREELKTVDIADRLNEIVSELTIIDTAINSLDIDDRQRFGFYMILSKQINDIIAVRDTVHPPKVSRGLS